MYARPMILANEDLSEGIYAASGSNVIAGNNGDWTWTASLAQTAEDPQKYVLTVDATHTTVQHKDKAFFYFTFSNTVRQAMTISGEMSISANKPSNAMCEARGDHGFGTPGRVLHHEFRIESNDENLQLLDVSMQCRDVM